MSDDFYPTNEMIEKFHLDTRASFFNQHVGYVYILGSSLGFYKIGFTNNLNKRFTNFGVKLPFDVWLEEAKIYFDCGWAEKYWHLHFNYLRVNGEWFKLEPHHLDTFHFAKDDTDTDVKLNVLYENNDWLPWDENIMGQILSKYPSYVTFRKKVIKDFTNARDGEPCPTSQYRVRMWEKITNGPTPPEFDLDKPFDPSSPGN